MSLSSFFKKVTKEEYQKDMVDRMGHSVVLTEAIVHTPSPSAHAKHCAKEKVRVVQVHFHLSHEIPSSSCSFVP